MGTPTGRVDAGHHIDPPGVTTPPRGYQLGVDIGTSFTAAAISRDGRLELVSLGDQSLDIPSVASLEPDGALIVGRPAERRGLTDPTRVAREFKRRLGDPAPILIAGTPFSAEGLMAAVLRTVVAEVTARQGEPPSHVTLTRPANWGPYKCELFDHVPVLADAGAFSTTTEPEAAAAHFASTTRVAPGGIVAVYDLGGGTFDAAVLRKTDDGFEILGVPEGIEHLGGADFDDAVFDHVRRVLGSTFTDLNPLDPTVRAAAARLRAECVQAKEDLSRDTETTIPVSLPGIQTEVRLTRQEFEDLIRPSLMGTVESLRRALRSAKVTPDQVAATVLAGGSSRIPLVAELIGSELRLPVAVGTHPKHAVALGAALIAGRDVVEEAEPPETEVESPDAEGEASDESVTVTGGMDTGARGMQIRGRARVVARGFRTCLGDAQRVVVGNPRRRSVTAVAGLALAAVITVLTTTLTAGGAPTTPLADNAPITVTAAAGVMSDGVNTPGFNTSGELTAAPTTETGLPAYQPKLTVITATADGHTTLLTRTERMTGGGPAMGAPTRTTNPVGVSYVTVGGNPPSAGGNPPPPGGNPPPSFAPSPGRDATPTIKGTAPTAKKPCPGCSGVSKTTVPAQSRIVGHSLADATTALNGVGFHVTTRIQTSNTPQGQILGMRPAGGSSVPTGSTITLTVSGGVGTTAVPDSGRIIGHNLADATAVLNGMGLHVRTRTQASTAPNGQVIGMSPAGRTTVPAGSTVTLTISGGVGTTTVPDSGRIIGHNLADATAVLKGMGLHVRTRTQASTAPNGQVIGMSPAGRTTVPAGSTVTLTVSGGPAMTSLPGSDRIVGHSLGDATAVLQEAGLQVAVQTQPSTAPKDQVLAMNPAGGTTVPSGSQIMLTVSDNSLMTIPNLTGMAPGQALTALQNAGWSGQSMAQNPQTDSSPSHWGLVEGQTPSASAIVPKSASVTVIVGTQPTIAMPPVTGLAADAARASLQSRGWIGQLASHTVKTSSSSLEGKIATQSPAAGAQVGIAATVSVGVYVYSPPNRPPGKDPCPPRPALCP